MSTDEGEFDVSRAELFEALGHHTRIGILQSLEDGPMSFSELKKRVGIESNGLLGFHLRKLTHLISPNQEGAYALTEQGKEAVRMIRITRSGGGEEHTIKVRSQNRKAFVVVIAVLLAAVIVLGSVAAYQQNQLGIMSSNVVLSHSPVLVEGTLAPCTQSGYVAGLTVTSCTSQINFTNAKGATVNVVPTATGNYHVFLAGGQRYNVSFTWKATISCSSPCGLIITSSFGSGTGGELITCPTGGCPTISSPHCTGVGMKWASANSTTADSSGSCAGSLLDLYSSTGSYNYDIYL